MANANSILLTRFFTRSAFRNLIDNDDTTAFQEAVQRYVQNYQTKNHFQCISDIFYLNIIPMSIFIRIPF